MKNYKEHRDGALVELTLLGNEKAYEELVIRHQNAVKGTAFKVTGNEYSAEDASQDAFVSAWMHLDSLRDRERFGSWVCSIAKNCARTLVSHYRSCAPDISLNILQDMELTAVSARTVHDNSRVRFRIVKLNENAKDPEDGEELEQFSKTFRYFGYHRTDQIGRAHV